MTEFRVTVVGGSPIKRALLSGSIGNEALRGGLTAGALIVQVQAKRDVHQVSGKLHDSTGVEITGSGWHTEAHIGPRPGYGGPRVSRSGPKGRAANPRRTVNRADPRDYARRYNLGFHGSDSRGRSYDQEPQRYLVEALQENLGRINNAVARRITAVLARGLR